MAARGVPKAQLLIRDGNEQVARFYERLGYRSLPRIVMQRVLGASGTGRDARG